MYETISKRSSRYGWQEELQQNQRANDIRETHRALCGLCGPGTRKLMMSHGKLDRKFMSFIEKASKTLGYETGKIGDLVLS